MRLTVLGVAGVLVLSACGRSTVELDDRLCSEQSSQCLSGYTCNPLTGECVRPVDPSCKGDGACATTVVTGAACNEPGGFVPCKDGATDCHDGCRLCQADGTWSACASPDCVLGSISSCSSCTDDCTKTMQNATPVCTKTPTLFVCDYSACNAPYRDCNGKHDDGCEDQPHCDGRCTGSDGCGGACTESQCQAPYQTCGGGGTSGVCGCTTQCNGKCGGPDGCGGYCDAMDCVWPASCGGGLGGSTEDCGCTPHCGDKCSGSDGCYSQCPNHCVGYETCGGGPTQVANMCGCTPNCTELCSGPDGCGGTCNARCTVLGQVCSIGGSTIHTCCTPACGDRCTGDDGCGTACTPDNCISTGRVCSTSTTAGNAGLCCTPNCGSRCDGFDDCGVACIPSNCPSSASCGGGGAAGECGNGAWWSCAYGYRVPLTITAPAGGLPSGHSLSLVFSHLAWINANQSQESGNDVRVVYKDRSNVWHEVPRVVDPQSSWKQSNTKLWFKLGYAIGASVTDSSYYVYFGNSLATKPTTSESDVFIFADFFDRPNSTSIGNGNGWVEVGPGGAADTGVQIVGDGLYFADATDATFRPYVTNTFSSAVSGQLQWRWGLNWTWYDDNSYKVYAQLGASTNVGGAPTQRMTPPSTTASSATDPSAAQGVGPNLVWGSFILGGATSATHNRLDCWLSDSTHSPSPAVSISGPHDVTVNLNTGDASYTVSVDNQPYLGSTSLSFNALSAGVAVDTIRFMTTSAGAGLVGRSFDYVLLRRYVTGEPQLDASSMGSVENRPTTCQ